MSYITKLEDDYGKGIITLKEISKLRDEYSKASKEEQNEMDNEYKTEPTTDALAGFSDENNEDKKSEQDNSERIEQSNIKEASEGWIVAGFILSVLGGWGGLVIGANYVRGNYNKETKNKGWIMIVIGIVMRGILTSL